VFYDLLRGIFAFDGDIERARYAMIALTLLLGAAAYAFGRRIGGRIGGGGCAALCLLLPPMPLYGARVLADVPAMSLAVIGLALALPPRGRWADLRSLAAGAALAIGMLIKLTALAAAPLLIVLLLWDRRRRPLLFAAAGGAVATSLSLLPHYRSLGALWDGAVSFHTAARGAPDDLDNLHEVIAFFSPTVPTVWLVALALLLTAAGIRRTPLAAAIWLFPLTSVALILNQHPLREAHLVVLPVSFGLAAGVALGTVGVPLRANIRLRTSFIAFGLILIALAYRQQWNRLGVERQPEQPVLIWAGREIAERTPPNSLVVTDQPLVAVLADRATPGALVDTARLRFRARSLLPQRVVEAIHDKRVEAVYVGRSFLDYPTISGEARAAFAVRLRNGEGTLYLQRR
jgi:4-amino-4-deoxy-L-arabinose transferase-like glycosyltransferase